MKKRNKKKSKGQGKSKRFSARASLIAIGVFARRWELFSVIKEKVSIAQKVIKHTPIQKLTDAFICILAGGKGLYEVNKRVRGDVMLQLAFGRSCCAEQSTISDTLNAATDENVEQMSDSITLAYRQYSRGFIHDYQRRFQLLDVDLSGLPCGKKAELASKGYFAKQKNKRGRQLGRVVASHYHEVVTSKLYCGKTKLNQAFVSLLSEAENILRLDSDKRQRTIIRTDAGGGTDDDINFMLSRGYRFITKAFNWRRAEKVCKSIKLWYQDPKVKGREVGIATAPYSYDQPTIQIGVRSKKKNGKFSYHLLVTNLSVSQFQQLYYLPSMWHKLSEPILWYALGVYDLRGGGCETEFKADKQGLGINKRNKKKFTAQQMLVLLADLAHNLCIWVKDQLASQSSKFAPIGMLRLVRDVFTISGRITRDDYGNINRIILNNNDPFAFHFREAIQPFLDEITVNLGEI